MQLEYDEPSLPETRPYYLREKAFWLIADASLRIGDHEQVVKAAAAGFRAYPDAFYAPDFLFLGGLALLQLERYEEAAKKLDRMIERFPGHANMGDAQYYLGYAYFYQTYFAQAIPIFSRVVEQFPDLGAAPDALFRIAECRFNLSQFEKARQAYREVIDRYPASPLREDALFNIAWCLMEMPPMEGEGGQMTRVAEGFTAYLTHYPQGRHLETARYTLAEISFNEGNYERAHELFNRIVAEFPGSAAAREAEAVLPELREALAYQEYGTGMEVFERAKEQESAELFRQAIDRFEKIWQHYPETLAGVGAKVNVGVCHQRLKEWERAVQAFEVIISEGEKGHPQVSPRVMSFCERRRGTIARKHL